MKKLFLYAAVAALAMTAASCQREILIDNGSNDGLVFAASIDGRLDTKTTLSGTTISWESTDSITVNGVVYKANSNSDGYYFPTLTMRHPLARPRMQGFPQVP